MDKAGVPKKSGGQSLSAMLARGRTCERMNPELLKEANHTHSCVWICQANPGGIVLRMVRKWFGTITVLLLINVAVGAQEQSEEQAPEQSPTKAEAQSPEKPEKQSSVQPAAKPVEESPDQSEKQPATRPENQAPARSAEQSSTQSKEQPPAQPSEQSPKQPSERSSGQSAELPPADAYRLTVTIHGAFGLCQEDEFGSQELYVVVKRLDLELQDRIDDLEREAQQITGTTSWRYAERRVDALRKRDFSNKSDPLTEAELESLERLRSKKPSERSDDEVREFRSLQARAPVSAADASVLARMKELKTQRRRSMRQLQMRSSANGPGSLRVYPDDELQVVLMEDDPFFDDTCFGSTVLLDQFALATPSLEIKKDDNTLLTLNFSPLSR